MKISNKLRWIILANVIILLIAIGVNVYNRNHLESFTYDAEAMDAFVGETYPTCVGSSVEDGFDAGLYECIPEAEMFLPEGYYRYTVEYTCNGATDSFCWPHSYVEYYNGMEQSVAYFEEGTHTFSGEFWTRIDLLMALRLFYGGTGEVTVHSFTIEETTVASNMDLFFILLAIVVFDILYYVYSYNKKNKISVNAKYVFFALMGIVITSSIPVLMGYALPGHDLYFHLTRIEGLKEGLLSGQFPVRINPDFYNGYGYANSIFYGELFLYIPALLRLTGFKVTSCYCIFIILINVLTVYGGYYCFKRMFRSEWIGLGITALYTLSSYRIMDVYLRAAVGEYTAMAFLPFVVYGMYCIYTKDTEEADYKNCFWPLVIGLSGIVQSHVLTGEITAAVIMLTCVILIKRTLQKKRFMVLVKTVLVTIGVNAWFLIPFVDFTFTQEIRAFANPSKNFIQKTGTYIGQIFGMFMEYNWDNVDSGKGITDEMPLVLGLPLVLGMFVFMAAYFAHEHKETLKNQGMVLFGLSVITIWMSTVYFPWDKISSMHPSFATLVGSIQFVWRFLTLASVLAATVTGIGLMLLEKQNNRKIAEYAIVGLVLLTIVSSTKFMADCLGEQGPVVLGDTSSLNTTVTATGGEYVLYAARHEDVMYHFDPRCYDGVEVDDYEKQGTNVSLHVTSKDTEGYVLLPLLNYSGYKLMSEDGILTDDNLVMGENAVVRINVPANYEGNLEIHYAGRWYWHIGNIISLLTIAGSVFLFVRRRKTLECK